MTPLRGAASLLLRDFVAFVFFVFPRVTFTRMLAQ